MPYPDPPRIIQITEVIREADQGMTKPILCTGEDGHRYYVKGQQTNRSSLWREWIAGHLAQALGLPIAPFSLVQVDEVLLRELPFELRAIGPTPAFGSQELPGLTWYENSLTPRLDMRVQEGLLVFDWWTRNADRQVGNTNLLWEAVERRLVVIDHNQAFDEDFDPQGFLQHHVFASEWGRLQQDWILRDEWVQRMTQALAVARWACDNAPPEWQWENAEQDLPANYDPEDAMRVLSRCMQQDFWRAE